MKKTIFRILLLVGAALCGTLCGSALGQNSQPQNSFSSQIAFGNPSVNITFNNPSQLFRENTSGVSFLSPATQVFNASVGVNPTLTAAISSGFVSFENVAIGGQGGTLQTVSVQFYTAPTAGTLTIVIGDRATLPITIINSFTVNVTSTTALQTFHNGTDFSGITVTSSNIIGVWTPSSGSLPGKGTYTSGVGRWNLAAASSLPTGANSYTSDTTASTSISATVTKTVTNGTVLSGQTGFDSSQPNNTAASFPYNAYIQAPNNTLGDMEWTSPQSILVQVDRLNWIRSGTKKLVSKGILSGNTYSYWAMYLTMNGSNAQFCFSVNARNGTNLVSQSTCSPAAIDMPNGPNYTVEAVLDGTGNPVPGSMQLYVNGQAGGSGLSNTYSPPTNTYGLGGVTLALAGGTAYATSTAFTSTGGGANCVVSGTMTSVSGIPSSITTTYANNHSCTSVPTIVLTAPTGTGVTIAPTLVGVTISTAEPLYVAGYTDGTYSYGSNPTASTDPNLIIDQFAIFQTAQSQVQVSSNFYQTKFYQSLLKALPSQPYKLIFDNDTCQDMDDIWAFAATIAGQRIGFINLAGVVSSNNDGPGAAFYRQALDQAGLAHIPVSVPASFIQNASVGCSATNDNTYNSATPQTTSAYMPSTTMYRKIFAANPSTPIFIMLGGSFRPLADFMASSADSISTLTGAQLIAQNATNGGAVYAQGLGANLSYSSDNSLIDWTAGQYVVQNNCGSGGCSAASAMPIYWYGGSPQTTGPNVLYTRNNKDPFFLVATTAGTDGRQAFDSLPTASFFSSAFAGGVSVAISGSGTSYANSTSFTISSTTVPTCTGHGVMVSSGGVPASITYPSGYSVIGVGYGCPIGSNPIATIDSGQTGSGVVLTATPTAVCGTVTITGAGAGSTSTSTCSKHYFYPIGNYGQPGLPPFLSWFLNSLIAPPPNGSPRVR